MGKRIVAIIDDEADIAAFLAELLTDEGYEPVTWKRGAGAYACVKRIRPAAVLLDMNMETPDAGLKVAEEICSDPETREIPIIIVSAAHGLVSQHHERLQKLDCKIHGKPVDIPALLSLLDEVIQGQRVITQHGNLAPSTSV